MLRDNPSIGPIATQERSYGEEMALKRIHTKWAVSFHMFSSRQHLKMVTPGSVAHIDSQTENGQECLRKVLRPRRHAGMVSYKVTCLTWESIIQGE